MTSPPTTLPVSVFYDVRASGVDGIALPDGDEADWPSDFLRFVDAATADDKLSVPAFIPGRFHPGKGRQKGATEANLLEMSALVLDYDGGVSIEEAEAVLSRYERVVYTTYKHTPAAHRFRVILPFPRSVPVDAFVRLQTEFHAWLRDRSVPTNPLPPSQVYFLATRNTSTENAPRAFHGAGVLLDPSPYLAAPSATVSVNGNPTHRPTFAYTKAPASPPGAGLFSGIESAGLERLDRIESKCAFMQRCRTDAATLPEPEWRAWLSVLLRCQDGKKHAHDIGKAYPRYSYVETEAKLERLSQEISGPLTCEKIRSLSAACQGCPLGAPVGPTTSPVQLGRPDATNATAEEIVADTVARAEAKIEEARARHAAVQSEVEAAARLLAEAKERRSHQRKFGATEDQAAQAGAAVADATRALETAKGRLAREKKILDAAQRDHEHQQKIAAAGGRIDIAGQLAASDRGVPYGSRSNLETILELDPAFANIRYDLFSERILFGDAESGEGDGEKASDIERRYAIPEVRLAVFREALITVARRREFHPVRDYLEGLRWDGASRLDALMRDGFGGKGDPEYLANAGAKLCLSAVARVYQPGAKVDEVVVLTGKEGARKSSGLRALASGWFSDAHVDMKSKDGLMVIAGVWLYELGELDSVQRAEMTTVKRFISTQTDRYRPPYAATMKDRPRQGILVGTTNETEFLGRDGHGDRRFVPISTDAVNVEWIEEHRDQLWAEAKALYDRGVPWHYSAADYLRLAEAQTHHRVDHPWMSAVHRFLSNGKRENPGWVDPREVLCSAEGLNKPPHLMKHHDLIEIGKVLKALGCEVFRPPAKNGTRPPRMYRVPNEYVSLPGSGVGVFGGLPSGRASGQILAYPRNTLAEEEPPF